MANPDFCAHEGPHLYVYEKENVLKRLKRIEGQTRGLARMVETDSYCIDILTQISATKKALESVAVQLLHDHLEHCVMHAQEGPEADEKLKEAMEAISRFLK